MIGDDNSYAAVYSTPVLTSIARAFDVIAHATVSLVTEFPAKGGPTCAQPQKIAPTGLWCGAPLPEARPTFTLQASRTPELRSYRQTWNDDLMQFERTTGGIMEITREEATSRRRTFARWAAAAHDPLVPMTTRVDIDRRFREWTRRTPTFTIAWATGVTATILDTPPPRTPGEPRTRASAPSATAAT